jgi:hypothetical protein
VTGGGLFEKRHIFRQAPRQRIVDAYAALRIDGNDNRKSCHVTAMLN